MSTGKSATIGIEKRLPTIRAVSGISGIPVAYRSAEVYFLTLSPEYAGRAEALYRRAIALFDQNTDEKISLADLYNRIASCYCYMDRMDDAVALLKKNNAGGKRICVYPDVQEGNLRLLRGEQRGVHLGIVQRCQFHRNRVPGQHLCNHR